MDIILKNIKDLRNEFSVSDLYVDGDQNLQLANNGMEPEKNKKESYNNDNTKLLKKQYQLLASNNNAKETTELSPDYSYSYYSAESDNRGQYEYAHNWPAKLLQRHRESLDSGHSSPEDSRSPSPTYSRILKSQSPTPTSSDDGIDIDTILIEDDANGALHGKSAVVDNEWQMVASKTARTGPKPPLSPFCDQRALCSKGNKCKNKHTQKEKELFEARKTAKTANDKEFSDTKFRTELCNKVNVPHNRKMCRFAHGLEQLVCKTCYEVGHKKETCTKPEKENLSPVRCQ